MVILIGAESYTGKTLMAQKLLEIYKIPYLSIDHLKMGLFRANMNCGFTPSDSNEVIESHLWPILKGIIDTNLENKQSIIIEGCYIFPHRLKEFKKNHLNEIIPIFMGFSKSYIENNYSKIIKHRSIIELREEQEDRVINKLITENEKLKLRCDTSLVKYFEIDKDYKEDVEKIYNWIAYEAARIKQYTN